MEYAVYKGDELLGIGTAQVCQTIYNSRVADCGEVLRSVRRRN